MTSTISRRTLLGTIAAGLAMTAMTPAEAQQQPQRQRQAGQAGQAGGRRNRTLPQYPNSHYYKEGKFDAETAKDAVMELLRYHGYPIYPGLREKGLYVTDFSLGQFTEVGLAGAFFANKLDGEGGCYMMQDLFLMPNQMLPEHWHVKPDNAGKGPQKDEGWFVRWGRSYIIGEGKANLPPEVKVPECHGEVTVKHCTIADPGIFVPLSSRGSHHWQFGGAEGVLLTEVANYHDDGCVRLLNKTANDAFGK